MNNVGWKKLDLTNCYSTQTPSDGGILFNKIKKTYLFLKQLLTIWVKVFKNGASKICGRQP